MPIDPRAELEITAFNWVPDFARGLVRDLRARWACEELGLAYRERLISAVHKPEWYCGQQPWGQVPLLRDGDVTVFESGAILEYLAEREGKLLPPAGQERAEVMSWLFAAFNSVEPWFMELATISIFAADQEWARLRKPSLLEDLGKRLDPLAEALKDREWIAGAFSVADIALVSMLRIPGDSPLIAERPALAAYRACGEARSAFRQALGDQLAAFADQPPPTDRKAA
jgi:glutathione S-transferase